MKNHNGDTMMIEVRKYHYDNLYNKLHDSDWLDADLIMTNSDRSLKINLEFLLVEEIERIIVWLNQIMNKNNRNNKLEFIDTNLKFRLMIRSRMPVLKVIYYINETAIESWELIIKAADITELVNELKKTIKTYPCRCGFIH